MMSINNLVKSFVLLLVLTITSCGSKNKISSEAQLLRIPYISEVDQSNRNYFVYLPKGYNQKQDKKWPVLVFLHGNGERGNGQDELDYVLIHGPLYEAWIQKRNLPFIIVVPQLHMFGRDTLGLGYIDNRVSDWIPKRLENGVPERPKDYIIKEQMLGAVASDTIPTLATYLNGGWNSSETDVLSMIDRTLHEYKTDENRVYLSGISYGGFGTWYIASKNPKRFAAINPVVAYGHPELMDSIAKYKIPVWTFAGGRDSVIPSKYFYEGINKLEALGHHNIRFTIQADMGHDTWRRIYAGDDIYNWLLENHK
jgi:predicted peptidase